MRTLFLTIILILTISSGYAQRHHFAVDQCYGGDVPIVYRASDDSAHVKSPVCGEWVIPNFHQHNTFAQVNQDLTFHKPYYTIYSLVNYSCGTWRLYTADSGSLPSDVFSNWGACTDIPQEGDFDGDGGGDLILYRPSTGVWYIQNPYTNQYYVVNWGFAAGTPENPNGLPDLPQVGDYDGDGKADIAVFRRGPFSDPHSGDWYILFSSTGTGGQVHTRSYAPAANGQVFPLDWDSDGRDDLATVQSGIVWTCYFAIHNWQTNNNVLIFGDKASQIPIEMNPIGTGGEDMGLFDTSNGNWYAASFYNQTQTIFVATGFGQEGDVPIEAYRLKP